MRSTARRVAFAVSIGAFLFLAGDHAGAQQQGSDDDAAKELLIKELTTLRLVYEALLVDRWPDDGGRPEGIPAKFWKVVSPDVGIIWVPRGQRKTDQAVLAIRVENEWHGVDPVGVHEFQYELKK